MKDSGVSPFHTSLVYSIAMSTQNLGVVISDSIYYTDNDGSLAKYITIPEAPAAGDFAAGPPPSYSPPPLDHLPSKRGR